ncbi:N-acetylglucosamine-6-phosphate deacetylase [Corynebacterium yudongzhengii]|uniref:N-acetylglucosamine-6-phosphate deacetylase n=1 Tax=Corynebacterium yudongzhengii TaxID=2080740 RepID=A0A2U1T8X8_9CORY|nr:N-acetylglucosamine-6-phosphate deacetylase [Corynebacterium yudongzhengii]AWB82483.1 N-acetylglucosamine-6-phosphate deacetylase [Corynebacterium yudongzhengii]PWC02461.1 N-acetylglucosamine-6-phosphate deacetylase [Corynebacterium yudongzhengii]
MNTVLITNATVYDGTRGGTTDEAELLISDGRIDSVGKNLERDADTAVIDAHGAPVVPGYIDIHVHGADRLAFEDGAAAVAKILAAHQSHGTARMVMSLVTGALDVMEERIRELAALTRENDRLLGIHPEGPFLHPEHKGAHDENLLRAPHPDDVRQLIDAADGTLVQFTLAAERDDGLEAVKLLVEKGIVASLGHSSATFEDAEKTFDAGARILTHAFNGMRGIHHRAPGPVIAALRNPNVWLEVINDGIHVHPAVVKSLFTEAEERMILITDAMSATCAADGAYRLGDLAVTVSDGVARLTEGGSLAGSTLTMDRAVANAVRNVGVPLDVAVAAATHHPAKAIGRDKEFGRLAAGFPSDILILDPETYLPARIFMGGQELSHD